MSAAASYRKVMVMAVFSQDRDILKHEAILFSKLYFPWQVLCEGKDGVLSGTSFSQSGNDFTALSVSGGGVIYLRSDDGNLDGVYEIVSVDSAGELTISVLREDSQASAVAPGDNSNVSYHISTFGPQANTVFFELTRYFGIQPGNPNSEYGIDDLVDTEVLRQAAVYAVIAGIYATLGSRSEDEHGFWQKSLHYQKLFEKARERCRISIDADGDGNGEINRVGGSIRIFRD